jgi:hypothetical protein
VSVGETGEGQSRREERRLRGPLDYLFNNKRNGRTYIRAALAEKVK